MITCKTGFYAVAPATAAVTLVGKEVFSGCKGKYLFSFPLFSLLKSLDIRECIIYGASGRANTISCVEVGINERTVTCAAGYYAVAPSTASVILQGSTAFGGCLPVDMCKIYGYNSLTENTESCVNSAINQRTIKCVVGFSPVGGSSGDPLSRLIILSGPTAFAGCKRTY